MPLHVIKGSDSATALLSRGGHGMPHRILIVDETPDNRVALERYLGRELGYEIVAAPDALAAFEAALRQGFNLAILNARLTGVSGVEAYRRLLSILPGLQAIFLIDADSRADQCADLLRYSVPSSHVVAWPATDRAALTRLIVGILGPPIA
jgi:CheY-like chemotaxis protein